MKKILTLIFSVLSLPLAFAGGNVDSLRLLLLQAPEDTSMVNTLEKLSWEYHRTHPEQTEFFAKKSLEIAERLNYSVGAIRAKNILAVSYSIQGKLDSAFQNFETAIQLAINTDNESYVCRTYNNLGRTYMKIGNIKKAVDYYQKAAACSEQFGMLELTSDNLLNMASLMQKENLSETVLKYAKEALSIAEKINNLNLLCDAHKLIGIAHGDQGDFGEAENHLKIAFAYAEKNEDKIGMSSLSNQLGILYFQKKQPEAALNAHRTAYTIASQINYPEEIITALQYLTERYMDSGQYDKAIEKSSEGIKIAEEFGAVKKVTKLYDLLAKCYAAQNNFPKAYIYHTKLKTLSDSLTLLEKNQKLEELKIQFQLESKEAENQLLKTQQAKDKLTLQKANIASSAIFILLIGLVVIVILLFKGFRNRKIVSQKLKEEVHSRTQELETMNSDLKKSNKEMERFNHIASHDLKEPLRNIISFTRLLERRIKKQKDNVAEEYLSFVMTNAKQMNTLIEDVLEFSNCSDRKVQIEDVDLSKIFQQVLTTLQPIMEEKTVHILCERLPVIRSNEAQIYIMLRNIIENGILYNHHPTPIIEVDYKEKNNQHHLSVTDNGIGIDPNYHRQIFDMFKRLHSRQEAEGSGLGLSICQKVAQRLGGDILIESTLNVGSTFTIVLPATACISQKEAPQKNQPIFKMLSS